MDDPSKTPRSKDKEGGEAGPVPRPRAPAALPLLIVTYAIASLLTMDMYLPAMPTIEDVFATGPASVQLTMTVYLAGFAMSQLIYGPLSDRYGRRPVMLLGGWGFVIGTSLCALSLWIEMLVAARFLQGITIGSLTVTSRAILRELYEEKRGTKLLAYISMAEGLSLALGPIIGAYILLWLGWRPIFWVVAIVAASALIGLFFMLPESNRNKDRRALEMASLIGTFGRILFAPGFLGYVVPGGLAFGGLMAYYTTGSFVLQDGLGLSPEGFAQIQFLLVLAYIGGLLTSNRLIERFGLDRLIIAGLFIISAGAIGLLGFALAGQEAVITVVIPFGVYAFGIGAAMAPLITRAMSVLPSATGSVAALLGMMTMGLAFLGSLVAQLAYTGAVLSMALPIAGLAAASVTTYAIMRPHREAGGGG
jgi:DHA1 family bicyclomycin/chloramphenicol resistance-like MFS transporter